MRRFQNVINGFGLKKKVFNDYLTYFERAATATVRMYNLLSVYGYVIYFFFRLF